MRYVQVNSVPFGSTGSVMQRLHAEQLAAGNESWTMWGRGRAAEAPWEFNYGTDAGVAADAALTRLDGRAGFHSRGATRRLLAKLDELDPDVVHLHNLHGYHVHAGRLFAWLAERGQRTVWTLHDCWAFTGHCAHFVYVGCDRWREGTCGRACPQLGEYPRTLARSSVAWNFEHKRDAFTSLPAELLTLQVPSRWLAGLVAESFLAKYPCEVRPHVVDADAFRPTPSAFCAEHGLQGKAVVLGVASPFTQRKGFDDFLRLREELDDRFAIVMAGLTSGQIRRLPQGILGLPRIEGQRSMAELYTAADVLFQPSREETFGLTIAEAHACGTPAVVYAGGACEETATPLGGVVVEDVRQAVRAIRELCGGGEAA